MPSVVPQTDSPWLHRLSVALVCATFPLIWVGAMVTTHEAGMAVPDWPTTYGYNPLRYPWVTWLTGPFDLFIEHGHRLLVTPVGLMTIALAWLAWRRDRRNWVHWFSLALLGVVCVQAVIGGMRVTLDARTLARLHACVGPLYFALAAAMAAFTSKYWRSEAQPVINHAGGKLHRLASLTALLAYLQIIVGAHLRHLSLGFTPSQFEVIVWFHLLLALALTAHIVLAFVCVRRSFAGERLLARPAAALVALLLVQLVLGCATWVTNFGWPTWMHWLSLAEDYVIAQEGLLQATVTTAHVAVGSLILATSGVLALRSFRLVRGDAPHIELRSLKLGVAL
ncbi:MAG: COX15/CtaA family protein [Planctomycetes bacterium]|nr:COX15/CtaA family protein [Planctomycetota bacterium]